MCGVVGGGRDWDDLEGGGGPRGQKAWQVRAKDGRLEAAGTEARSREKPDTHRALLGGPEEGADWLRCSCLNVPECTQPVSYEPLACERSWGCSALDRQPNALMWGDSDQYRGLCVGPAGLPESRLSSHSEQPEGPSKPKDGASRGQEQRDFSHFQKKSTRIF